MNRRDAIAAVDGRCPRCGAMRDSGQEYCVECGLRLPPVLGAVPSFRRAWVRRLGWYPGDWVWLSVPTLLVAIGGAAAAIALGGKTTSPGEKTSVAPVPRPVPVTTTLPSAPEPAEKGATTQAATTPAPEGPITWPSGRRGWTIVLSSYPVAAGSAAPSATAGRAARAGLPEVGVLDSARFSSLHPGYYIVFSGIYSSAGEAAAALQSVRATGFSSAYTRQISR